MAKQELSKKIFNICIVCIIIVMIIFASIMLMLHYNVNGETNMPFKISKINVISSTDGSDTESQEYKWSINVCQNNDIYIYVEKNDNHTKPEIIKSINVKIHNTIALIFKTLVDILLSIKLTKGLPT